MASHFLSNRTEGTAEKALDGVQQLSRVVTDPWLLIHGFTKMATAIQRDVSLPSYSWTFSELSPSPLTENSNAHHLPIAFVTALQKIPRHLDFLRSWFISLTLSLLPSHPEFLLDILILLVYHQGNEITDQLSAMFLRLQIPREMDFLHTILSEARKQTSPYVKARALARLQVFFRHEGEGIFDEAQTAIRLVESPEQRGEVLELLFERSSLSLSPSKLQTLVREMEEAVQAMAAGESQVLAMVRLAFHKDRSDRVTAFKQSLSFLKDLTDLAVKATLLSRISPILEVYEELLPLLAEIRDSFTDPLYRGKASNQLSPALLRFHPVGLEDNKDSLRSFWNSVVTLAVAMDCLQQQPTRKDVIDIHHLETEEDLSRSIVELSQKSSRLTFSRVLILDQLLVMGRVNQVCKLLELLNSPPEEALPVIRRWLSDDNDLVKCTAHLLLVESNHCLHKEAILPFIQRFTQSAQGLLHYRIAGELYSSNIYCRDHFRAYLSHLGVEAFEILGREYLRVRSTAPGCALHFRWFLGYVIVDQPAAITRLVDYIQHHPVRAKWAACLLENLGEVTDSVWQCLLQSFATTDERVQRPIFRSFATLRLSYWEERDARRLQSLIDLIPSISNLSELKTVFLIQPYEQLATKMIEQLQSLDSRDANSLYRSVKSMLDEQCSVTATTVLQTTDVTALSDTLRDIDKINLKSLSKDTKEALKTALKAIENEPAVMFRLLLTTIGCLRVDDGYTYHSLFLEILDTAVQLYPIMFHNLVTTSSEREELLSTMTLTNTLHQEFVTLLINTVRYLSSFPARVSSLHLLVHLQSMGEEVMDTFELAFKDVADVRAAALSATSQLVQLHSFASASTGLSKMLDRSSQLSEADAMTLYNRVVFLSTFASHPSIEMTLRRQIRLQLSQAAIRYSNCSQLIWFSTCKSIDLARFIAVELQKSSSIIYTDTRLQVKEGLVKGSISTSKSARETHRDDLEVARKTFSEGNDWLDQRQLATALQRYEVVMAKYREVFGSFLSPILYHSFLIKQRISSFILPLREEVAGVNDEGVKMTGGMKKFSVPCLFGNIKSPFTIYLHRPAIDDPIFFQGVWLKEERGGDIPPEVRDSMKSLLDLAKRNNVDFAELCVYALNAAQKQREGEEEETDEPQSFMVREEQLEEEIAALSEKRRVFHQQFASYSAARIHDYSDEIFQSYNALDVTHSHDEDLPSPSSLKKARIALTALLLEEYPFEDFMYNFFVSLDTSRQLYRSVLLLLKMSVAHLIDPPTGGGADHERIVSEAVSIIAVICNLLNFTNDSSKTQLAYSLFYFVANQGYAPAAYHFAKMTESDKYGCKDLALSWKYYVQASNAKFNPAVQRLQSLVSDGTMASMLMKNDSSDQDKQTNPFLSQAMTLTKERLPRLLFEFSLRLDGEVDFDALDWARENHSAEIVSLYEKFPRAEHLVVQSPVITNTTTTSTSITTHTTTTGERSSPTTSSSVTTPKSNKRQEDSNFKSNSAKSNSSSGKEKKGKCVIS